MIKTLLATSVLVFSTLNFAAASSDDVILKYNGGEIKISDLDAKLKTLSTLNPNAPKQAATELPYDIQVNLAKSILINNFLNEKAKAAHIEEDPTVQASLKEAQNQFLLQTYLSKKADEAVTEAEISSHYKAFVDKNKDLEEVKFRSLLVSNKEEAEKALEELKSNSDFEAVSAKYSKNEQGNGKEIGYMPKGSYLPAVEEVLFDKLKQGEISEPVETELGWHILKLEDKRKVTLPAFEAVKTQFAQDLKRKYIQKYVEDLLTEHKVEVVLKKKEEAAATTEHKVSVAAPVEAPSEEVKEPSAAEAQEEGSSNPAAEQQAGEEIAEEQVGAPTEDKQEEAPKEKKKKWLFW